MQPAARISRNQTQSSFNRAHPPVDYMSGCSSSLLIGQETRGEMDAAGSQVTQVRFVLFPQCGPDPKSINLMFSGLFRQNLIRL